MTTVDGAGLLTSLGNAYLVQQQYAKTQESYEEARIILTQLGELKTPDGARLFMQLGKVKKEQLDMVGALKDFEEAKQIYTLTGTLKRSGPQELENLLLDFERMRTGSSKQ